MGVYFTGYRIDGGSIMKNEIIPDLMGGIGHGGVGVKPVVSEESRNWRQMYNRAGKVGHLQADTFECSTEEISAFRLAVEEASAYVQDVREGRGGEKALRVVFNNDAKASIEIIRGEMEKAGHTES